VKLLVDMNLSPSWVERLAGHGFEAAHWSTIGAATVPDVEIRSRGRRNQRPRRVTRQRAPSDHVDESLRMLVRVLARQAARERFEREVAAERETQHG
jgi:hypothetical protein